MRTCVHDARTRKSIIDIVTALPSIDWLLPRSDAQLENHIIVHTFHVSFNTIILYHFFISFLLPLSHSILFQSILFCHVFYHSLCFFPCLFLIPFSSRLVSSCLFSSDLSYSTPLYPTTPRDYRRIQSCSVWIWCLDSPDKDLYSVMMTERQTLRQTGKHTGSSEGVGDSKRRRGTVWKDEDRERYRR